MITALVTHYNARGALKQTTVKCEEMCAFEGMMEFVLTDGQGGWILPIRNIEDIEYKEKI